jgi:kinesin family member 2/24
MTQKLYMRTVQPVVFYAMSGGMATCFAFGQTGSGKTHTMLGCPEKGEPGMYILAAKDIFAYLPKVNRHLYVTVSFFEIYGDEIYDLLNSRNRLVAREDAKHKVQVMGLKEIAVTSGEEVIDMLREGSRDRSTGSTGANDGSSRSHAILQVAFYTGEKRTGKLCFIDLAGSERGADTYDNSRETRLEGAQINKSLLALKECIRAMEMESTHTPFRSSKLTQVLKESLIGNGRTVMVANISPSSTACEHSLNTLRYAGRCSHFVPR